MLVEIIVLLEAEESKASTIASPTRFGDLRVVCPLLVPRVPSAPMANPRPMGMSITNRRNSGNGWEKFDLNVGGFVIKWCRWKPSTGSIVFPKRRTRRGRWRKVVQAYPPFLKQLRALLKSGQSKTPRDRRPCNLKIHGLHVLRDGRWYVFGFTTRTVTIWGCRLDSWSGSVQLPVTFFPQTGKKRRVVCAWGTHVNRLRKALYGEFLNLWGYNPVCFYLRVT
jgi:hypothetical protein